LNKKRTINPGDVVEIFEQKRLMTAVCVGYKSNRLQLVTETSKLMTLSESRVIHTSRDRLNPAKPRKEVITNLRVISSDRHRVSQSFDLETLWNSMDFKGQSVSLQRLGSFFKTDESLNLSDVEAGFLRAVHNDKIYFKNIDQAVYVYTEQEATENMERLDEQNREQRIVSELVTWINDTFRLTQTHNSSPPEGYDRLIHSLKADATQKPLNQNDKNLMTSVIKQLATRTKMSSFDLLVRLKELDPDENLDFIRYQYPVNFMKETLKDVHALIEHPPALESDRHDLTNLECFTIDNYQTKDYDDALSFHQINNTQCEIGIHIADVSYWVSSGSNLDQEALERGLTLYLPPKTWYMFPEPFSENIASLKEKELKPAMSVLVTINTDGTVQSSRIVSAVINVSKQFTYNYVDTNIDSPPFSNLLAIAETLQKNRLKNGAVIMPRPEINIDASNSEQIVIHRRNRQSPSQLIVSELMILANSIVSEFAAGTDIPFPYRCQDKPDETIPRSDHVFNPYVSYCQRKVMPRAGYSLTPQPHFSLGLQNYTNFTSPIRRYFDVLAQRQLKAVLGLDKPYSFEEMEMLMTELDASAARAFVISNNQHRYWLFRYLEGFQGQTVDAMVLDRFSNGYQVFLMDLCLDAFLPLSFGHKLYSEQVIKVILERVSPRENVLKLRLKE
jgi:exoribonuclease II